MSQIIFGFCGLPASGKGAAAEYLKKKYHASAYRFSTMLRDVLQRFYLEETRDNLVKLSEIIRGTFGEDAMAKTMANDVANDTNPIVMIEGIRRPADIAYLSKLPNFVMVEIFADPRVRYERLHARGENADDSTKTFEEFLADHKRSTELSILEVIDQSQEKIDNGGTPEQFHAALDALVNKYC